MAALLISCPLKSSTCVSTACTDQLSVSLYLPTAGTAENTVTANSRALQSWAVQGVPQALRMSQKQRLFLVHLLILFFFSLLLFSVETVNDGQFHSVELVMLNQTLNLVVDKGAPKSLGKLQKQSSVSLNTPLYIGGTMSCSRIEVLTCFLRNKSSSILWRELSHSTIGTAHLAFQKLPELDGTKVYG